MLTGQLMLAKVKISLLAKLLSTDISCTNNTLNYIHNNIISSLIHIIQLARTCIINYPGIAFVPSL